MTVSSLAVRFLLLSIAVSTMADAQEFTADPIDVQVGRVPGAPGLAGFARPGGGGMCGARFLEPSFEIRFRLTRVGNFAPRPGLAKPARPGAPNLGLCS